MIFFLTTLPLFGNGLEFRVTLSGKLLLGLGYRYQIDTNTAVRIGGFMGVAGAPVGFHIGMLQDISPSKRWTPFFELGADMLLLKKQERITPRVLPSANLGISYCAQTHLRHNAEVWLAYMGAQVRPMGLSYVHFNPVD